MLSSGSRNGFSIAAARGGMRFHPRKLYAGGGPGLWVAPSDMATGFQDTAGATLVTASGDPIGRRNDKSGNGLHLLQATAPARLIYDVTSGIRSDKMDGADDGYQASFPPGTLTNRMDLFMALKRNSAGVAIVISPDASAHIAAHDSGNNVGVSNAGVGAGTTSLVNGVVVPGGGAATQGAMAAALTVSSWVILEVHDLDLAAWTAFRVSLYSGYPLNGQQGGIILCASQSDAIRAQARRYLAREVRVTL